MSLVDFSETATTSRVQSEGLAVLSWVIEERRSSNRERFWVVVGYGGCPRTVAVEFLLWIAFCRSLRWTFVGCSGSNFDHNTKYS
jgi:hypothetical protein